MINVLHAIDTGGPGGAETVLVKLAQGLDPVRFRSIVSIGAAGGWLHRELDKAGIEPLCLNVRGSFNFPYLQQIISAVRGRGIDLIHSHLPGSNLYCSMAGLLCRVPVISTYHGLIESDRDDPLFRWKLRIVNRGSKRVVFVSEKLFSSFQHLVKWTPGRCSTIYNGLDLGMFRPCRDETLRRELRVADDQILIGSVGNIRPAKGYEDLLWTARIIVSRLPACRFVIIGQGEEELMGKLLTLRKELELEEKVHFIGFRDEIWRMLNNLDLFLLTSRTEGFSISCIEAMACGVPVIATRSGGPEEILTEEQDGLLVPVGQPEEIARAVIRMIEDTELRSRLTREATETVVRRFDLPTMIGAYAGLYQSVCGR
jgi:glycosyltransferase involved in cell wall biosynthesis